MDCEDCRDLTVVGLHDTGPRSTGARQQDMVLGQMSPLSHVVDVTAGHRHHRASASPALTLGLGPTVGVGRWQIIMFSSSKSAMVVFSWGLE